MLKQASEEKKKEVDFQGINKRTNYIGGNVSQNNYKTIQKRENDIQSPTIQGIFQRTENNSTGTLDDYGLMKPEKQLNDTDATPNINIKKPFKSRYVDDKGAWTYTSVDDGYVDFADYIKDRRDGVDNGISFNGKQFKLNNSYNTYDLYDDVSYGEYDEDEYPITYQYGEYDKDEKPINYYYSEAEQDIEPYKIGGELDEVASIKDRINNISDEDIEKWEREVKSKIKDVLSLGKKSPFYDDAVSVARKFWELGAENILNKKMKCYSSAWLLQHALEDNPSDIYRGNNTRIAWLVNTNKAYLKELDKAIRKSNGRTINTSFIVDFDPGTPEEYDLYFGIHSAGIEVDGYKRDDGKWIIHSILTDTYDFTKLMWLNPKNWVNIPAIKALGMTANDAATISSLGDVIKPYKIKVEFYTTR